MDCVLGYHLNPLTCGIAKFNLILAQQFRVPVLGLFDPAVCHYQQPLLSIKVSEFRAEDLLALTNLTETLIRKKALRVFFHAFAHSPVEMKMIQEAEVVYCGNAELVAQLRHLRPDVVEVWCPGMFLDLQRFQPAEISVFSFGMAHKVRADYYGALRALLDKTEKSYCVYLSTALHEGTSFDDSFAGAFQELREIFDGKVYFLGYLSDTAVYNYLSETTFFAAFFDKGVRANNTSVNAAMQCGSVVITNLDDYSPTAFVHFDNLLDIQQCRALPTDGQTLAQIGARAQETALHVLGWEGLVHRLEKEEATPRVARRVSK